MTVDTQRVTLPPLKSLLERVYCDQQSKRSAPATRPYSTPKGQRSSLHGNKQYLTHKQAPPLGTRYSVGEDTAPVVIPTWQTSSMECSACCCSCPLPPSPTADTLSVPPPDDCGCFTVPETQTHATGHKRSISAPSDCAMYWSSSSGFSVSSGSTLSSPRSVPSVIGQPETRSRAHSTTGCLPRSFSPPPFSDQAQQHPRHRYQCVYCSKTFSRPSSLRIHLYSHTGEKPHRCPYPRCDRRFSVQSNMRRHLRGHYSTQYDPDSSSLKPSPHQQPYHTMSPYPSLSPGDQRHYPISPISPSSGFI